MHAVLDEGVRFRCEDVPLLRAIDEVLGPDAQRRSTVELGVVQHPGGVFVVEGWGDERSFGSRPALLEALPTLLNQVAAGSTTCVALHAGCVRSPAGEVVLLPAVSGSGKTTLTAALVQAGWSYGSDEAVGLRSGTLEAVTYPKPLVLDATSREALGLGPSPSVNIRPAELRGDVEVLVGSAGPVSRVVLPRYEAGAAGSLSEPLEPREAILAVLEHTLNLTAGRAAWTGGAVRARGRGAGAAPRARRGRRRGGHPPPLIPSTPAGRPAAKRPPRTALPFGAAG